MKQSILLLCVLVLSGCSLFRNVDNSWSYECVDGYEFQATFADDNDSVLFKQDDRELRLDRIESASGGKCSDGFTTLWAKGAGAQVLYEGEIVHQYCTGDRINQFDDDD